MPAAEVPDAEASDVADPDAADPDATRSDADVLPPVAAVVAGEFEPSPQPLNSATSTPATARPRGRR
jgi:hypothetical protein